MKIGIISIVLFCIAGLFGVWVWHHEARHSLTFVSLSDGEEQVHPARTFQIAYAGIHPPEATFVLEGQTGPAATLAWHPPNDPATQLVHAVDALEWDSPYRLCVFRQRTRIIQRLLGPRTDCIGFRTQPLPVATGAATAKILVIVGPSDAYGAFYRPILAAEGFSDVATIPVERLTPDSLEGRAVTILALDTAPPWLTALLSAWKDDGGLLIAMRPGRDMLPMMGLPAVTSGTIQGGRVTLSDAAPLTHQLTRGPITLHGSVDLFASPVADSHTASASQALVSEAQPHIIELGHLQDRHGVPLPYAAAILVRSGQGVAVTFPFSMAETVALTRQGNPNWVNQDRDGSRPLRPNDLFYPDHVDLDRFHVPQADELQRLLANIIVTAAPQPIPRLWYLPQQRRAVVMLTGDDHATQGGTQQMFDLLERLQPPDCQLARWDCLRASSYLDPETHFDSAAEYAARGFEIGVHVDSGCADTDPRRLAQIVATQMQQFATRFPGLPKQQTERLHCIVWSGWVDVPRIERENGIRFDLNYYTWPPAWLGQRSGFMTGSGFPMPFIDENGLVLDVYQAATHMVNENGVPQTFGVASLLDRAMGSDQFFGAFGSHVDYTDNYDSRIIEAAMSRNIALISARQMLDWLDARNGSHIEGMDWDGTRLAIAMSLKDGAEQASVMLPVDFGGKHLRAIDCGGQNRAVTEITIKGIAYGFFQAMPGRCEAQYGLLTTTALRDRGVDGVLADNTPFLRPVGP
ncbi:MAG: hypothetical protein ACK4YU_04940 [Paracoccus sp. (in: a-proteobacteria)]